MNLGKEIDRIGRDIAAWKYLDDTVMEEIKVNVFAAIDGHPCVDKIMQMVKRAYIAGWVAAIEARKNEDKTDSSFRRGAQVGASACG